MENSKLNELEIRLNEEMEKDAEEIDMEKLKRLLDQIGEPSLTNDQKQELSLWNMIELEYRQNGDYLLPDLGLTEAEQMPLGKYGLLRRHYLEENRPGLYTRLMLSGKLMEHLQEIEQTAQNRLESLMNELTKQAGVTEALKARDQMTWVQSMNALQAQAEEMILSELIYA